MIPQRPATSIVKISNVYFTLALIVLVASVVYGGMKYRVFAAEKKAVVDNEARYTEVVAITAEADKNYKQLAYARAGKQVELEKKINAILPPDENYLELTRRLDDYFKTNDKPGNTVFQSSLRFGKGTPVTEFSGVSFLPFSMNIEATRDNFFKFLQFVESTGSLGNALRLMEINSIQLNFEEGGEMVKNTKQKLNFTIDMGAYYQTPRVTR